MIHLYLQLQNESIKISILLKKTSLPKCQFISNDSHMRMEFIIWASIFEFIKESSKRVAEDIGLEKKTNF